LLPNTLFIEENEFLAQMIEHLLFCTMLTFQFLNTHSGIAADNRGNQEITYFL